MNDPRGCPECGTSLPADAPRGLCPVCLMGAAILASETAPPRAKVIDPPTFSEFKRMVVDMGIVNSEELLRIAADEFIEVSRLSKALVRAGKLTSYQAAAIAQGKARGLLIGDYLVLDRVGQGGMGVVFKARHRKSGRVVALKMLPPSFGRERDVVLRFRREFEVASRLNHPNVVSAIDASEDRGVQFLTMEYIDGHNLNDLVDEVGALPIKLALHCAIQAARGLEAAHSQGIIHRDIKPGNLMLDASGMVRVLDLGLARVVEATTPFGKAAEGGSPQTQLHNLTQSGVYMGTVDFIAPEQADDSRRADHRADIYSLGCTLFFLLTGHPPFVGDSILKRLLAHQERPAPSLRAARPDAPEPLDAIYLRMMAKKPGDRSRSMTEVITALEACRTSADESKEARAGLKKAFAETVMKRASGVKGDRSPVFKDLVIDTGPAPSQSNPAALPLNRRHVIGAIAAVATLGLFGLAYYSLSPPGESPKPRVSPPSLKEPSPPEVSAMPPSGPLPRLLYEDDFSDVASRWGSKPDGRPHSRGYHNGVYFLDDAADGSWFEFFQEVDTPYTCEVLGRVTGSDPKSRWALCAPIPTMGDRGFEVSINGRGELFVGPPFWVAEKFPTDRRVGPIVHPAIKPGNVFNRVRIKVKARQVEVFVNDVRVCEPVSFDADLIPCKLMVALVGGPGRAEFDKVQVRELDLSPGASARDAEISKDFLDPGPPVGPIVVAASGPATYRSVFEAVQRAKPGETITVQPGVYREQYITLTKPVEILGNGAAGSVVIDGKDNVFSLASFGVRLRNLTIGSKAAAAVISSRGEQVLEDCDLAGGFDEIAVMGDSPKLTLTRCKIHGSMNNGIWAGEKARLILDDCDVYGNAFEGMYAGADARCEIRKSRFYENGRAGLRFTGGAFGKIENSEIHDNTFGGVQSETGSAPVIQGCRINRNKGFGVDVLENSGATVEDSDLTQNAAGPFSPGANTKVTRKNNKE